MRYTRSGRPCRPLRAGRRVSKGETGASSRGWCTSRARLSGSDQRWVHGHATGFGLTKARMLTPQVVDIVPQAGYDQPKFAVHTNDSSDNGLFDQIFYATPWYTGATDKGLPGLHGHLIEPIP